MQRAINEERSKDLKAEEFVLLRRSLWLLNFLNSLSPLREKMRSLMQDIESMRRKVEEWKFMNKQRAMTEEDLISEDEDEDEYEDADETQPRNNTAQADDEEFFDPGFNNPRVAVNPNNVFAEENHNEINQDFRDTMRLNHREAIVMQSKEALFEWQMCIQEYITNLNNTLRKLEKERVELPKSYPHLF